MLYEVITVKNSDSSYQLTAAYTYDVFGNKKTEADGNGNVTERSSNPFGWELTSTLPGDITIGSLTAETTYTITGQIAGTTDSTGRQMLYTYDSKGNCTGTTQFSRISGSTDSITTSAVFDILGQKVSTTNELGTTTTYTYDTLGRCLTETLHGETEKTTTYTSYNFV